MSLNVTTTLSVVKNFSPKCGGAVVFDVSGAVVFDVSWKSNPQYGSLNNNSGPVILLPFDCTVNSEQALDVDQQLWLLCCKSSAIHCSTVPFDHYCT